MTAHFPGVKYNGIYLTYTSIHGHLLLVRYRTGSFFPNFPFILVTCKMSFNILDNEHGMVDN